MGDQFDNTNDSLIPKAYSAFYFSINFGSTFSTILTPLFLQKYGPGVAFGVPGILMFIATIVFWLGRNHFIIIKPSGWDIYKRDLFSPAGIKALINLGIIYIFIAIFWALYDQTGSSWVLQAEKMNRIVNIPFWGQEEILSSQLQAINPILIMLYIPLFSLFIYPFWGRFTEVTSLKKMGLGFFITAISFAICAEAESLIQAGLTPSMWWQIVAYFIITSAEVLISVTILEFTYTQSPNSLKSFFMGYFLLSVSLGNFITAQINKLIGSGAIKLYGASYYWFFTALVTVTGVIFVLFAKTYKEEKYIQGA
jgi:POT family proton-dependent oligopeptide transporter